MPLAERFDVTLGKASWRNRIEQGSVAYSAHCAFHLPANAPPEFMGVLARARLKAPGQRLKPLPAGEAWRQRDTRLDSCGHALTLYGKEAVYAQALPKLQQLLNTLCDGGVTSMAGQVYDPKALERAMGMSE